MTAFVCHDCDLICRPPSVIQRNQVFKCPRCRAALQKAPWGSLEAALALTLAALFLFILMNANPLMSMQFQGTRKDATLAGAAIEMWNQGMHLVAALVVATTIVAPILQIGAKAFVIYCVGSGHTWRSIGRPLRALLSLRPWSMTEILMLAILVSLVKLQAVAQIILGPALWACAALVPIMSALTSLLSPGSVWYWMNERDR
jgi:paraquat-inducible protein A